MTLETAYEWYDSERIKKMGSNGKCTSTASFSFFYIIISYAFFLNTVYN